MSDQQWFSATQLAGLGLPGLPTEAKNILLKADRDNWNNPAREGVWWRKRSGRGGGIEYSLVVLPTAAKAKLAIDTQARADVRPAERGEPKEVERREIWAWFERQTDKKKAVARERLTALQAVRDLMNAGTRRTLAMDAVARECGVSLSSLYEWDKLCHRVHRSDWLPYLCPRHRGQVGAAAEMSPDAWDVLCTDYLRLSRPTLTSCYERLTRRAAVEGWAVPCEKTVMRKLQALPPQLVTMKREGMEALKRMFPAQQRTREGLHALEVVNADFHTWDVFVAWPGVKTPVRPSMIAFQDIYSGKILSWRLDLAPNKHAVRLAFGDLVEAYGIPDHCVLDNGREFASKWITGGLPTRFRFKVRDEEPEGLLVQMGVQVHWATPYHGQAKPIERAFRDMAVNVAKHPRFDGAYTGNKPTAKPEDYGSKAVPLDVFIATIGEEIALHNARLGRTGGVCNGRSFDAVFEESYAKAAIRKSTEEQRRLWLMAAEAITVSRVEGVMELFGNRFWGEALWAYRGQKLIARFDPQRLQDDLHVYRTDGIYLGAMKCQAPVGFMDADAAKAQGRLISDHKKATKALDAALNNLSVAQIAAALPSVAQAETPEARVVRPAVWGNTARQVEPDFQEPSEAENAMVRAWTQQHGGPRLVPHSGDD